MLTVVRALVCILFLGCISHTAKAQILPFRPLFPRESKECERFSKEVSEYTAEYEAQHNKCLAENKSDRQDETHDSLVCSRSRCQYLHDMLFGGSSLSAKSMQKEVTACYEQVRQYQAEEARKAKEKADEEAEEEAEEARKAKEKADEKAEEEAEATQRKKDLEDRGIRDNKQAKERAAEDRRKREEAEAERKQQSLPNITTRNRNSSSPLVDPFPKSNSKSQKQEIASNIPLVDPFSSNETIVDPFPASPSETWDRARGTFEGLVGNASAKLDEMYKSAHSSLSPSEFRKFEHAWNNAHLFVGGLDKTLTQIKYAQDIQQIVEHPRETESYHDIISDGASHGFSYVLKRVSPDFLSKLWEGPVGWTVAITFDSSTTQTPKQDFDPVTALNNPSQYSFQRREAALQRLYESAQRHPEVWDQKKYQWLYSVSEQLYNSHDNPNIRLTPP